MPRKPYRTKIEPKRVEPGSEPQNELDGDAEDLTVPGALVAADLNVDGLVIPGVGNLAVPDLDLLIHEEPDEQILAQQVEESEDLLNEEPLNLLENPAIAVELSEDPVRL